MHTGDRQARKPWGAKLNTGVWHKATDCPAWANPAERKKWQERGLILWDHDIERITRLHADQALQILDYVRSDDNWDQQDIVVGEPATRIVLGDSEQEPREVLLDEMTLGPSRLRELLELLERSEPVLQRMKEEDEAECDRRLAQVYDLILSWAREASEEKATDANPDEE